MEQKKKLLKLTEKNAQKEVNELVEVKNLFTFEIIEKIKKSI